MVRIPRSLKIVLQLAPLLVCAGLAFGQQCQTMDATLPVNPLAYLGLKNWGLPSLTASCPTYGCGGDANPMGNLYYDHLNFIAGTPVVPVPDIAVGPFHHLQPFPYWSCLAGSTRGFCESADNDGPTNEPSANSEWGFSFVTGFLGTERLTANHFVTAYYVVPIPKKPPVPTKCPPTDPSCYQ